MYGVWHVCTVRLPVSLFVSTRLYLHGTKVERWKAVAMRSGFEITSIVLTLCQNPSVQPVILLFVGEGGFRPR